MTISFPSVKGRFLLPSQEQFTENAPFKTLIVGQKNGGTAISGALVENIGNSAEEDALFGANSMAAGMVRWFKKVNKESQVDVISLNDNGGGVPAEATITFATTADENGSFTVSIGSKDHVFTVPVTATDTPTIVAAALAVLINSDSRCPVTAGASLGVVTLTAVNAGDEGNHIGVRGTGSAGAMTMSITAFSAGDTNPDLIDLFDPIDEMRYQAIVFPSTYDRSVLESFLDARWSVLKPILDGIGIMVLRDTFANVVSVVEASNSQTIITGANPPKTGTNRFDSMEFTISNQIASYLAGIIALRETPGANLSDLVVADGVSDKTGGIHTVSLPYANTPLKEMALINNVDMFKRSEIDELNDAGAFTISNSPNGTQVLLGQLVTAYKLNTAGNPDLSLKYLNYVRTFSAIREFYVNNLRARFPQNRLPDGDLTEFFTIENQSTITSYLDTIYQELADRQLVIKGPEALAYFKENRFVSIDKLTGSAYAFMRVPIVTQLRNITFDLQLSFDDIAA